MARQKVIRPWFQSWWFISLVVVLFCVVFGALTVSSLKTPAAKPTPTASASATG